MSIIHIQITIEDTGEKFIDVNNSNCSHDDYIIETAEELSHPDDPRGNRLVQFAVCEKCHRQGSVFKNKYGGITIDWRNDG